MFRASHLVRIALSAAVLALGCSAGAFAPAVAGGPTPLNGIAQIAAGTDHVCARLSNREVRCWGDNDHGQLGDGTRDQHETAVTALNSAGTGPLRGVVQITAGEGVTCAALASGQARCWGANNRGQLGDGTKDEPLLPVPVSNKSGTGPLVDVISISSGGVTTCAVLATSQVRCWGYGGIGQLGNGSNDDHPRPVVVRNEDGTRRLTGAVEVVAGSTSCSRLISREMRCWGYDGNGQLGDGKTQTILKLLPVAVRKPAGQHGHLTEVRGIAGLGHICARLQSGRAVCWGPELFGILGNGETDGEGHRPVVVLNQAGDGPLMGVAQIALRYRATCARLTNDEAVCWGSNETGGLGDGDTYPVSALPVTVMDGTSPLADVAQVTVGSLFACARLRDGTARCWGTNASGQLGDGSTEPSPSPVTVMQ